MSKPKETTTWMGIACVIRKKNMEEKREEYIQMAENMSKQSFWNRCWFNLMEYYLSTKMYSHCELAFPLSNGNVVCYTATRQNGVCEMERAFNNNYYEWFDLEVTMEEAKKVQRFCKSQLGKIWDEKSAKSSVLFPVVNEKRDGNWWCCSFVVAALQKIGIIKYYNPYSLDIDDLVLLIKQSKRRKIALNPT